MTFILKKRKRIQDPEAKRPKKLRSGFEAKVKKSLEARGVEFEYESERLPYTVPESRHNYTPDFVLVTEKGTKVYVESKGNFTAADRKKMLLVVQQHPELDIRLLFMRQNKIQRNSKTTYGAWCDKHGIPWAVSATGFVPDSWIRGDE
jgi:predicted nuclease of restriction endonuclease-like RecB superfamily